MVVLLEHPLFLLSLTLAVFGFVSVSGRRQIEVYRIVNGVRCDYREIRRPGGGRRGISLICQDGKRCVYFGANPHNCGNDYNQHQDRYYYELAGSAMENGAPCVKPSIQESICGLTYPCESGDCLPSSSNNDNMPSTSNNRNMPSTSNNRNRQSGRNNRNRNRRINN